MLQNKSGIKLEKDEKASPPRRIFIAVALVCLCSLCWTLYSLYQYTVAGINGASGGDLEVLRVNGVTGLVYMVASGLLLYVLLIENRNQRNTMAIVRRLNWTVERLSERSTEKTQSSNTSETRWPWGSHHTELLGHLEAAANRWWALYDSSDPSTAPKNEWVVDWLKEQGVSNTKAEAIASILRADGLKTGPR